VFVKIGNTAAVGMIQTLVPQYLESGTTELMNEWVSGKLDILCNFLTIQRWRLWRRSRTRVRDIEPDRSTSIANTGIKNTINTIGLGLNMGVQTLRHNMSHRAIVRR
jgi:hypothetical protein